MGVGGIVGGEGVVSRWFQTPTPNLTTWLGSFLGVIGNGYKRGKKWDLRRKGKNIKKKTLINMGKKGKNRLNAYVCRSRIHHI